MNTTRVDVQRYSPRQARARRLTNQQLPSLLRGGETVIVGHGSGWPREFVGALVESSSNPFRIVHNRVDQELPYFTEAARQRVRHTSLMLGRSTRAPFAQGWIDYIPNSYGSVSTWIRDCRIPIDIVVLHLSPPDASGFCSLGTCSSYLAACVERATMVVAQINPQMPRTVGTRIHLDAIDYLYYADQPLVEERPSGPTPVSIEIADRVASLVDDGSTIQIGIGALADTVVGRLVRHHDLRFYSETFGDAALELIDAGALRSSTGEPALTATFVTGSRRLYDFAQQNEDMQILPVDYTNDPARIAAIPKFVAINSAVEVDLTGQINAEAISGSLHSGSGGQLDFAIGASRSRGGRYVVTLPSTADHEMVSRIVPTLGDASPVTVPRSLAGLVVTEFGIADLRGKSLEERAEALISIAHPNHRQALRARWLTLDSRSVGGRTES